MGGLSANTTDSSVKQVHGKNPMYLVEKITRERILDSLYWKEHCFGLTSEGLVEKAADLNHYGGHFGGNIKTTPFLALTLKLLQLQPEKEIVVELIKNEDFKYVRALGAFYLRLTGVARDIYHYLEPLYDDFRKIRFKNRQGKMMESHVDELIDVLLNEERACDVILPRLLSRDVLEELGQLTARRSALDDDFEDLEEDGVNGNNNNDVESSGSSSDSDEGGRMQVDDAKKHEQRNRSRSRDRKKQHSSTHRGYVDLDAVDRNDSFHRSSDRDTRRSRSKERKRSGSRDGSRHRRKRHRSYSRSRSRGRGRRNRDRGSRDSRRGSGRRSSRSRSRSKRHSKKKEAGFQFKSSNSSSSTSKSKQDDQSGRSSSSRVEEKSRNRGSSKKAKKDSMSIEETNALRASLGLKLLKE